jgi:hypothetical protein
MLNWFERAARRPAVVVMAFVLNFGALALLFQLEARFTALTGLQVFDTQNDLTVTRLLEQRALYVGEAREAYLHFAAIDFVFPFVASLALATLWAFLAQRQQHPWLEALRRRRLYLLPFAVTVFDYGENVALLRVLDSPEPSRAELALLFKHLKLTGLAFTAIVTCCLALFAFGLWVRQRRRG